MIDSEENDLVLVNGFGWTGASALIDFVLMNTKVKLAGNDEIPFIKALSVLFDKCLKRKKIDINNASEAIFCSRIPNSLSAEDKKHYKIRFDHFFSSCNVTRSCYVKYAEEILTKLELLASRSYLKKIDHAILDDIMLKYIYYLHDIVKISNSLMVYDNVLPINKLNYFSRLNYANEKQLIVYFVDRDPRDQFYELFELFRSGYNIQYSTLLKYLSHLKILSFFIESFLFQFCAAVAFIHFYYKPRRRSYKENFTIDNIKGNNIKVQKIMFEDIILNNKKTQQKIKSDFYELLSSKSSWDSISNFDVEYSKKNINKYSQAKFPSIYKFIAWSLK